MMGEVWEVWAARTTGRSMGMWCMGCGPKSRAATQRLGEGPMSVPSTEGVAVGFLVGPKKVSIRPEN